MYINFCLAPSNKYVGWVIYENGHYFGSGNTIEEMANAVKNNLYFHKRVSRKSVYLNTKPTEPKDVPLDKMDKKFKTRAWFNHKTTDSLTQEQKVLFDRTNVKDPAPKTEYDYYTTKTVDGKLVVYGCVKVAEYQLDKTELPAQIAKPMAFPSGPITRDPYGMPQAVLNKEQNFNDYQQ